MAIKWLGRRGIATRVRPWWRPLALSAATAAAIAALFNPVPALAAPTTPPAIPGAVPDTGTNPFAAGGTITMPGEQASSTTPSTTTPISTGLVTSPTLKKIEAGRTEIARMGEELAKLQEDLTLVTQQLTTATTKVTDTQTAMTQAEAEVRAAAATSVRDAAALPPGALGSGLQDLDSLARIQRGDSASQQAAARQLDIVKSAHENALLEQQALLARQTQGTADQSAKQTTLTQKSAAQQKLEQDNATEINAADAAEAAQDAAVGADYLAGEDKGRGADPRALAALKIALAQRGDPYVWSEEGPNQFDCSGLMYYAYRSAEAGNFPLVRVSRDQYNQTNDKTVDRYSLLPGDLLFFSSSNSWTEIHHVAMYAGDGMMVEAPRTGLDVRLTPVRWTRLFAATRIYGSVDGAVEGPDLGPADPETPSDHTPTKPGTPAPTTSPTKPPSTTPTKPSTSPTPTKTSKPPTTPSTSPSTTPPSTSPSTTPPTTTPPTTTPPTTTPPTTTAPSPEESETTSPAASSESTKSPSAETSESKTTSPSASAIESAQAKQSS
ncbi:C40 family peptidase [Winogradskya humida]|nr:C40 family peptidase [Actinoplanes humidus]